MLQAAREADAAVNQAAQIHLRAVGAARGCNTRVQDLIGDLSCLQQSQSELTDCKFAHMQALGFAQVQTNVFVNSVQCMK